jgi:Raf kinase inhibitor-like YbhB/YbcL family protein
MYTRMRSTACIIISLVTIVGVAMLCTGCSSVTTRKQSFPARSLNETSMSTLQLTSPAFSANAAIPREYSCQGSNTNPPLAIAGVPAGTKSLELIVDDPDAPMGVWDHWVVWNIAPDTMAIAANSVPAGAVQGKNSGGNNRYDGPCPPSGTHHYRFTIYALSVTLDLPTSTTKDALLPAMKPYILDQNTLVGTYQKS